jgi:putative ABC transport system permease protein
MNRLWQDLKYALRLHFKNPKLAIVIITTLGLGIGCLTAVFTVVNSVLIRPLQYRDPAKLVRLFESNPSQDLETFSVSPLNWIDWRQNQSFEDLGVYARQKDFNLSVGDKQQQISANRVSANLFQIFGAQPFKGELFTSAQDKAGGEDLVILSFDVWNNIFAKDPNIIGKKLYLDRKAYRIVAVMDANFRLPFNNGDIYLPLALDKDELTDRSDHFLRVIGRLKKNVAPQQALQEMKSIATALAFRYPESNKNWTIVLRTLNDVVVPERFRNASWVLLAAALLVLMIACLNAANLLTARTIGRHRELSIRRAIGATTRRLFAQLLTESLLIAFISGVLGILLAVWGVELLHSLEPQNIPRLNEIHVDPLVMLFGIAASFLTVLLFGTLTARQSMKQDLQEGLKEGSLASTTGTVRKRLRNVLVIIEAALSVVLLICAGLLMKSFMQIQNVDLGFNPDSILTVKVTAPVDKYSEPQNVREVQKTILEKVRAIPGVQHAALTSLIPMGPGNSMTAMSTEGPPSPNMRKLFAPSYRIVSPSYFKTMKIQLLKGQYFSDTHPGKSLIIDEFVMRKFWHDQDPIGVNVFISGFEGTFEVIGVVHHVKSLAIDEEAFPMIYLSNLEVSPEFSTYVLAKTSGSPMTFASAIQKSVVQVDPNLVIGNSMPLQGIVSESLSQRRFNMVILAVFAGVALILATIGLYSVISYSVSQRSHEIGIRMALGAGKHDVVKMVVKEGMMLVIIGVAIGIALSVASTRMLAALLYFVSPTDAMIFQVCAIFFLVLGILSAYIPARRASALDPVLALRHE